MLYATMTRMPASVAMGISPADRPKKRAMSSSVTECVIPATGVRPPFLTFVAVRAIAPVAGIPPNSGDTTFATPCASSSMLERCRPPIIPSATTAERSDSTAPSSAIVNAGPMSRGSCSSPTLPAVTLEQLPRLMGPAFTIALLGAVESLLSAVVADGMIGGRHRSNMELLAQGVANVVSPLFGGIPATGAIARTATNVKNGGRTPVAGITHSVTLLLIALFFGRSAGLIPMATLAGILVIVAYSMSEWRTFVNEFRAPKSDVAVLLTTFLLTVFWDLTVAIEVGMVLAAFLFMRRMAEVTNISALTHEFQDPVDDFERDPNAVRRRVVPPGVEVYEITGPFFFGAAETFKDRLSRIAVRPKVLILRMRHVPAIDSTGLHALRELVTRSRRDGTLVLLSDVHAQPVVALERSGMYDELGEENIHGNIDDALNRAREHLGLPTVPRPMFATPTVAREKA